MKKIWTKKDCDGLMGLPPPVHAKIEENVALLNFYYGENRDVDANLGGYVLLIENEEDIHHLKNIFHVEIEDIIPEYADVISWHGASVYVCAQIMLSDDYSVVLLTPYHISPKSLLKCVNNRL